MTRTRMFALAAPCLAAIALSAMPRVHASRVAAETQAPPPAALRPGPGPAASPVAARADADPRIAALLGQVSETRLRALLEKLTSFGTRNTLSTQDDPARGIGAASQWIHDELRRSSARLQVGFDVYDIPAQGDRVVRDVRIRNVMAVLPGRTPRRIYISGHYDSLARVVDGGGAGAPAGGFQWGNADNVAPGANDDGSGTVLVMELARVFAESGIEFDATLVFIAFAGEEQGLVGAHLHAQRAVAEKWPVAAVFNNDIVGNSVGGNGRVDSESVRVFAEGPEDSPSRALAQFVRRQAARYVPSHRVRPIARHDRFGRGGDHTAFNQRGFPGVRITEANENYGRQHMVEDTIDGVDFAYLARNARVNGAAAAVMALAPPVPVVTDERGRPLLDRQPSGYDARLRWQPSAGAVAYRVTWREAWAPDWQYEMLVGAETTCVLPDVSIDDFVFGVSAVGPAGHESPVAAYLNPPRAETTIRTKP